MTTSRTARTAGAGILTCAALLGLSCAYYNTLYNAEQKYDEAEKADARAAAAQAAAGEQPMPGRNPQAAQYEAVIEKCKNVMVTYPDSRHVDDAMLLSAKSLYRLGRYEEGIAAIDSLEQRYPDSNVLDDAAFLKGKLLVADKKYDLAILVLRDYVLKYRKHDDRPEGLYLLCTSLMQLGLSKEAVVALQQLEKDHGRSNYRFKAQVDMAKILAEKELYEESLDIYERMSESRIPEAVRFDVLTGMARVQEQLGEYASALETLGQIQKIPTGPDKEPGLILLRARAYAGIDSTTDAIREYKNVAKRFARGMYGAEAYYRLGELYEGMDSLETAQRNYQEVPRAYSGSPFAEPAIKRGADIGRMLKLQETSGNDSPEAIAMRTFSMAEIQYFQFGNVEKAIVNYEEVATDYPDNEFAPRAVYALGYLYGVVKGDTTKAREWYDVLRAKYPDSPQTQLAWAFYKGAPQPPPYSELMMNASVVKPGSSVSPPTPRERTPRRPEPPPPAPVDTTRTNTPPAGSVPAGTTPADTTRDEE